MKITSIRFNLKFFNADGGGDVVRSLDDLAAKFNLCDLWEYFRSGDLARWLKSINKLNLAEQVKMLTNITNKQESMNKLCETLKLTAARDEILELCEILDRQELAKESHKKLENIREQMRSGEVPEVEACESLSGFENTYYIDNFNSIMADLDKFQREGCYGIEKLKVFEQKFIRFLNRWGRTFIQDFIQELPKTSGPYEYPQIRHVILLSLLFVNQRWHRYAEVALPMINISLATYSVGFFPFLATEEQKPVRPFFNDYFYYIKEHVGVCYYRGLLF